MIRLVRHVITLLLPALLALGAAGLVPDALANDTVTLGIGDWPPYFGQDLKNHGSFAYLVSQAFAAAGHDVVYSQLPWKRALAEAESGALDGSPGWKATDERKQAFLFSDPVVTSTSVFFHLKAVPLSWSSVDDLKGLRIGVSAGYSYGPAFDAAVADKRLTVDTASDDITAFKMLLGKRVDLVVMNRDVGLYLLRRKLDPGDAALIVFDEKPIDAQPSCLMISRKAPHAEQLIADFNRGLAQIRSQGMVAKVMHDLDAGLLD